MALSCARKMFASRIGSYAYSDEVGHLIRRKSATYSGEFGHPLRVRRWAQVNVSHVFDRVNVRQ